MSPNVGNFVHDLVEMAKAMEELPGVRAELENSRAEAEATRQMVASREEAILRYKAEIESLNAKVRATEAERDDAELRFLELDEKTHKVLGRLDAIVNAAISSQDELNPPKPVPMPEPIKSEPVDIIAGQTYEPVNTASGFETQPQDQSEPLPTHDTVQETTASAIADQTGAAITENVSEPTGPYSGKRYYDHPTYVTHWDWIAGGGTDEDYQWRPSHVSGSY